MHTRSESGTSHDGTSRAPIPRMKFSTLASRSRSRKGAGSIESNELPQLADGGL
jgi:hypothetical protein